MEGRALMTKLFYYSRDDGHNVPVIAGPYTEAQLREFILCVSFIFTLIGTLQDDGTITEHDSSDNSDTVLM